MKKSLKRQANRRIQRIPLLNLLGDCGSAVRFDGRTVLEAHGSKVIRNVKGEECRN